MSVSKKSKKTGKKASVREDRNFAIVIDRDRCKGCGLCVDVCPKNVLLLDGLNYRGYPVSAAEHPEQCIKCRRCENACPDFAIYIIDDALSNSWAQQAVEEDNNE